MKLSREAREALAAEFALGTLRGRARARFESMRASDRALAETVARWETAINPLAQGVAAVEPPARVWRAIEARVAPPRPGISSYWRPFAIVAGGMATVLLAFLLWTFQVPGGEPDFVAVLTAPDNVPRMVVSMNQPGTLKVRMVKPWKAKEGMGLELWVMPKDGKPRSLGMVKNEMGETVMRMAHEDPRVSNAVAFAVSMEPMAGSPTGQPTGPVLCSGSIAPVRSA
ncbi:MAG TPA: anti-sigma factor [Usitatibacter sp.]|nr:anti-sigma factor [Usitatibacter sp.]